MEGNLPLDDLNEGITPGYSSFHAHYGSSDSDTIHYSKDMKKHRKVALEESQEPGNRACNVPVSASDLHTSNLNIETEQASIVVEMEKHKENIHNSGESS